jgi:trigger factor
VLGRASVRCRKAANAASLHTIFVIHSIALDTRMSSDSTDLTIAVQEPNTCSRRLTITIPAQRVRRTREQVTQQVARSMRLPGFRKGKVPTKILEQQYGPSIEQETLDRIIQDAYREALQQHGFNPINQGKVENVQYERDTDLTFDVEFEVRPELRLERLSGFAVARPPSAVGDDEVDSVLERLREEQAPWHPLPDDQKPDFGDQVMVRITPLDPDGEPKEGEQPRTYRFALGEGKAVPTIEESIMTLTPGEQNAFTIEFGEGEGTEEQAGTEQFLRIELVSAQRKQLPELDGEFARSIGEFESLDALRERILTDLREDAERRAEGEVRGQLLNQIVEANPFEVPGSMVDRYLDYMTGHSQEEHEQGKHQHTPEEEERISQIRESLRPQAVLTLQRMLVIERVGEEQGLRATQDEIDTRVEELAKKHEREPREIWLELEKSGQLDMVEREITEEKVFDYLKSQNTVTE